MALRKRNSILEKKDPDWNRLEKELKDEIGEKNLKIKTFEEELLVLREKEKIMTNENISLLKRVNNQGFQFKVLMDKMGELVEENTELSVQLVTLVAYAVSESKRLDFDNVDEQPNPNTRSNLIIEGFGWITSTDCAPKENVSLEGDLENVAQLGKRLRKSPPT